MSDKHDSQISQAIRNLLVIMTPRLTMVLRLTPQLVADYFITLLTPTTSTTRCHPICSSFQSAPHYGSALVSHMQPN